MSAPAWKIGRSVSLLRLFLVVLLTALTFQVSVIPSEAIGGFGGGSCSQMCEQLCTGNRNTCLNICNSAYPAGSAALSQCQLDCSNNNTLCHQTCLNNCS